jgi:hypothetical protein
MSEPCATGATPIGCWIDDVWLGDADSADVHSTIATHITDPINNHIRLRQVDFAFMCLAFRDSCSSATPAW